MKGSTSYDDAYDAILRSLWDVSTGGSADPEETTRGAGVFAEFVLSELQRKNDLELAGETALARRGLSASNSILAAWVWNVVEDCSNANAPLPPAMLTVLYHLLGCNHLRDRSDERKLEDRRMQFEAMRWENQDLPVRATARELGVDPATIVRWKNSDPSSVGADLELYQEVRLRTGVTEFWSRARDLLRK